MSEVDSHSQSKNIVHIVGNELINECVPVLVFLHYSYSAESGLWHLSPQFSFNIFLKKV